MEDQASLRMAENAAAANTDESTPMSPSSPSDGSKVKNWLKTKFSRRMSKAQQSSASTSAEKEKDAGSGFVGGAALTGASADDSSASLGAKSSSVRDVAMAGKAKEPEVPQRGRPEKRDSEVSALSEAGPADDEEFQEARDNFDEDLAPPPTFSAKGNSPVRSAKFTEEL